MTMPHLMNCSHSETGWCLACVKELHDEGEARYEDYLKLLPLAYAAEEWASGHITSKELAATIASGFDNHARGLELMSRLVFLEDEEKQLMNEIAYLKAALERKDKP